MGLLDSITPDAAPPQAAAPAVTNQIIGAESGGNPNAQNPNSSASGLGQFIDSTWLDMLKQHRPDIQGSDADLIALKSNPDLSREMTAAYAADNGKLIAGAGLPVTPGNTYLAHFAGPQGAIKVLQADPNAPVGDILGASAVKANPFLQGMTVQGLQAWASHKMGAAPPQQAAAAPPLQLAPPNAPIFAQQPPAAAPQQQQAAAAPSAPPALDAPAAPIFAARRPPVDISKLRAAFAAPQFYRSA